MNTIIVTEILGVKWEDTKLSNKNLVESLLELIMSNKVLIFIKQSMKY